MIKIICVGKIKEKFFKEAIEEYTKRLSKYTKLQIIEVEDVNLPNESLINFRLFKSHSQTAKDNSSGCSLISLSKSFIASLNEIRLRAFVSAS